MAVPVTGPAAAVLTSAADDEAGAGGSADVGLPEPLGEWLASGAVRWLPALAAPLRARPPAAEDTPAARVRRGVASVLERGGCGKPAADRLLATLPSKWEKLGDLAMLPSESLPEAALAAAAPDASQQREIWGVVRAGLGVQRLARQAAVDSGVMRQSRAVLLDAQDGADGWVTHRENGITYIFDATKVMFSSGNGSEKMRVAKLDCSDEVVLDLYAGIGYFTLPLLVHARAKHLHACELNPDSIEALRRGLAANGVADRCTVYPGDNQANAPALAGKCDRVHLGLIPSSELGWPLACAALRRDTGGVLHVHANVHKAEIEQWTARLMEVLGRLLRESDAPEPEPEPEPATASAPPAHPAQRAIWSAMHTAAPFCASDLWLAQGRRAGRRGKGPGSEKAGGGRAHVGGGSDARGAGQVVRAQDPACSGGRALHARSGGDSTNGDEGEGGRGLGVPPRSGARVAVCAAGRAAAGATAGRRAEAGAGGRAARVDRGLRLLHAGRLGRARQARPDVLKGGVGPSRIERSYQTS